MAKNNLTSREWCDIIFQNKNKEYGAYQIRLESPRRYNQSLFITLVVVLAGFSLMKLGEIAAPKTKEVVVEVSTISTLEKPLPAEKPEKKYGEAAKKGGGEPKQRKFTKEKPGAAPVIKGEALPIGSSDRVNKNAKSDNIKIVQRLPEEDETAKTEKASAAAANRLASSAFGRAKSLGGNGAGTTGTGTGDGSRGNSETGRGTGSGTGYGTGNGSGNGSFDLDGRSLGPGGLPRPNYNVREEGRVVITIVVNPEGRVIRTSINKMTNTTNPALRRAAEEAAKKARFNVVSGLNNQTGTITYYFKLK
ncbi:TonB family protein [Bacteroides sedimenti]|uniref:TonB C-terminal domain-containing protein n=1 Tax=Bacteroides sedimenti TaxID=2136147 RepID=A0ABN6Z504_9BACE